MVLFSKVLESMTFKEYVVAAQVVTKKVNALFINAKPLEMQLEKMYESYLLISKKNYIGIIIKDMKEPKVFYTEEKGVKQKKKGTTKLGVRVGRKTTDIAVKQNNREAALEYIRDVIIKLKQRRVTLSDLIKSHNFGGDITVALFRYMIGEKQAKRPPPPEAERKITERYNKLDQEEKEKNPSFTAPIVLAYKEICKDPNKWYERGNTIHFIFREGVSKTKRDLVCSVADAISQDIPYNVNVYKKEIMNITRKVMGTILGDKDINKTPIYEKMINGNIRVTSQHIVDHVSFFQSRFGPRTIKKETGHKRCDTAIKWMVNGYKGDMAGGDSNNKSVKSFSVELYPRCAICNCHLNKGEIEICEVCKTNYCLQLDLEAKLETSRNKMDKKWDICKKCQNSDKLNPLDCITVSCNNYTRRLDKTKQYYTDYVLLNKLNSMGELF